jgi:hypothetical protein
LTLGLKASIISTTIEYVSPAVVPLGPDARV